jgi:hypothetical protein
MDRAHFLADDSQSWWLCEKQIDYRIDEARKELGTALGLTENEWFADPNRRTLLFDLLESKGSQLLYDLDYLTDDEAKLRWVHEATRLAAPPPVAPTPDDTTVAAHSAKAETAPAAPQPAPAKKSIFKSKAAAGDSDAGAAAEAPQLDQAVLTVFADVTGDGLAGLAQELGVEADELDAIVHHPDFEREVREEVARITAG